MNRLNFLLVTFLITSFMANAQLQPILQWTAPPPDLDKPLLGYELLKNMHTSTLYTATPSTGTYSHHSHITYFEGSIYTMWSNHLQDEDAPGQRVLMRRSSNHGETWAEFVELFPPLDRVSPGTEDGEGRRTQCANGFAIVENTLYAFSEVWSDGGENREGGQGRLVRPILTDGTLGTLFWLGDAPEKNIAGMPLYPAGYPEVVGKINAFLRLPGNELTWEFKHLSTRHAAVDNHKLCEPTPAWKRSDGTWVKMYRDLGKPVSRFNYASFSFDNGATWSKAIQTNYPDSCARSTAGVLPDGQVYVISNISPRGRDPLVIALSQDGLNFDKVFVIRSGAPEIQYKGRWKGKGFQYPHSLILEENLWVIYSVGKEDVQITRIPLDELRRHQGPE